MKGPLIEREHGYLYKRVFNLLRNGNIIKDHRTGKFNLDGTQSLDGLVNGLSTFKSANAIREVIVYIIISISGKYLII